MKTSYVKTSPHLPDDVVWEILSRIPPRILLKLRTVSLSWYNMISHPSFIEKQKSNFLNDKNYFNYLSRYYSHDSSPAYIPVGDPYSIVIGPCNENYDHNNDDYFPNYYIRDIFYMDRYAEIVGSCNGLLCYSNPSINWYNSSRIYLHNPCTKKTVILPQDPFAVGRIGSDPTREDVRIGLCYDESNHDYKVVIIPAAARRLLDDDDCVVAVTISIYSLKNNSWERVKKMIPRWIPVCFSVSLGLKETVYWYCTSTLIAFDSSKLAFKVISYPLKHDLWGVLYPLTIANGSLWIMGFDGYRNLCGWMMKRDEEGEMWVKKFECYIAKGRYVMALSYQGRILLRVRRRRRRKLVILDPETKKEKTVVLTDKWNLHHLERRGKKYKLIYKILWAYNQLPWY